MEMKTTVELAQKNKIKVILADREIRATLARAWTKIGFFSRFHLGSFLLTSLFVTKPIPPEEIERMKSKDVLEDLLSELPKAYIPLKNIILDERDSCLAENIRQGANEITKHTDRPSTHFSCFGGSSSQRRKAKLAAEKTYKFNRITKYTTKTLVSQYLFLACICHCFLWNKRNAFSRSL